MMPSPPPFPPPSPFPFPGPAEPDPVPGPPRPHVWFQPAEPVSVYEQLLRRRIVLANGHLTDETATRLCAQLLTLDAEGDDFALKFAAGFLEGADIGHGSLLSFCFRARDHRGLDGDRQPDAIGAAPLGRSAAEDGGRAGLLFREE